MTFSLVFRSRAFFICATWSGLTYSADGFHSEWRHIPSDEVFRRFGNNEEALRKEYDRVSKTFRIILKRLSSMILKTWFSLPMWNLRVSLQGKTSHSYL